MNAPLLSTVEEIKILSEKLMNETIISFDTEFIRENTFYPEVELLQIGTATETFLVDVQAFRNRAKGSRKRESYAELEPLFAVFESPQILKIVHAALGDQECLYTQFGIFAAPSMDTAVAAALCGYGDQVGLASLLKQVLGVNLKKGHARTNWARRPLPPELLEYASDDVVHLVKLGQVLIEELEKNGRKHWAMELSKRFTDPQLIEPNVDTLLEKTVRSSQLDRVEYKALRLMLTWREARVRELNLPRRWIADDQVLMDLARARPKTLESLSTFRGLNKGEIKHSGLKILECIHSAMNEPGDKPPKKERFDTPSTDEAQALSLLKCFVGLLSEKHRIITRLLVESHHWLQLIRTNPQTCEDLKGVIPDHSIELIGQEIVDFLNGRRSLSVKDCRVLIQD